MNRPAAYEEAKVVVAVVADTLIATKRAGKRLMGVDLAGSIPRYM